MVKKGKLIAKVRDLGVKTRENGEGSHHFGIKRVAKQGRRIKKIVRKFAKEDWRRWERSEKEGALLRFIKVVKKC